MFKKDQKIYGYVLEDEKWISFDSWYLMDLDDVDYRVWKSKYEKQIHVNRNKLSPLVYFNRGHRTYSYYSKNEGEKNSNNSPITLSHLLREKVISEKKEALFSFSNEKMNKNDKVKYPFQFKFKQIQIVPEIEHNGEKRRPDIVIEFDEPADLALKWNHKLYIEVVEKNEVHGDKIEFYRSFTDGIGVIEIPYSKDFDIFKGRSFKSISKVEAQSLERKITNYFNKSIWADVIVDIASSKYINFQNENQVLLEKKKLETENLELKAKIKSLTKRTGILKSEFDRVKNEKILLTNKIEHLDRLMIDSNKTTNQLKSKIKGWNNSSVFNKIVTGLKIK
ncbi:MULTISPECIES: hypothetical protein [unclassified Cellulophaga]|uniref:hypothetical protein n=1 Tax=unclassified Cellulophaga TaxID=2634405 RepID=UPI0026E344C8|nr:MULTISPECIES: hypothetical protein [unclassified Cellulophaga]MDO6492440.1 hypothetical protein [Cellulophaga sp. 2_MG-2023]MDO6496060.1 hypothetical protein [Cellulophaga sp. 3_MG-2023]